MSYSQNSEERILLQFFKGFTGSLLSIGENDGVTLSNARALIEKGWEAVLIEPDEQAFKRLADLYPDNPKVRLHKIAIGSESKIDTFYSVETHLNNGDTGLLSTLNLSELQTRFPGTAYAETQVEVMTWQDYYTHAPGIKTFDFISIDAESFDLEILRQIDFNQTKTRLVCVEWNSKDRHLYDAVMYPFGFRILHLNGENILYVR